MASDLMVCETFTSLFDKYFCHGDPSNSQENKLMPCFYVIFLQVKRQDAVHVHVLRKILDKIEDVQESIFTQEPKLLKALVPIQTMHLTIFVAHLKTEDDIKRAISALEHSKAEVRALLQRQLFCMTFHGTGQFNNKVIYVKMSADEQHMLSKIAGMVLNSFMEMNIDVSSSRDVKPQLTFLKLSKDPAWRRKGFRKTCESLYVEYKDTPFGTESN